jgi:hypothetical protein
LGIEEQVSEQAKKKGIALLLANPAALGGLLVSCGCLAFGLFFIGAVGIGVFALNNDDASGGTTEGVVATTACGTSIPTVLEGYDLLPTQTGKLGYEEHLNTTDAHYCGADSGGSCNQIGNGSFYPRSSQQERWYFNTLWGGWDWEPTRDKRAPIPLTGQRDREARATIPHKKLILTSKETGRSIVVSAEESGPALWVAERDGIWYGAPPEVYNYLGTSSPYTGNPSDGKGLVTVGFAEDQNINLGPCLTQ